MRYLIVLVLCLSPLSVYATDQCPQQSYTDAAKEPNYDCPSPQEYVLVPDLPVLPSVSLKKDDKAPREGILLDVNRVFQLGLRIKALRHIRWIETTASDKKIKVEVGYQQSVAKAKEGLLQSQVESYKLQLQTTQAELEKERKWYKSWTFGVVVGVVVTAAGATALGYALRK